MSPLQQHSGSAFVQPLGTAGFFTQGSAAVAPVPPSTRAASSLRAKSRQRVWGQRRAQRPLVRMAMDADAAQKMLDKAASLRAETDQLERDMGRDPDKLTESEERELARKAAEPPPPTLGTKAEGASESDYAIKLAGLDAVVERVEGRQEVSVGERKYAEQTMAVMEEAKALGFASKWKSYDYGEPFSVSQGQLKQQANVDEKTLDVEPDLYELKVLFASVLAGCAVLAVLSGIFLKGNLAATGTYLFAVLPVIFLGVGSTAPGLIFAALNSFKEAVDGDFADRRLKHEAAHFLAGYVCGLPLKAVKVKGPNTEVEFYDTMEGDFGVLNRQMKASEITRLSVVALSGGVGEVLEYGMAKGAAQDLEVLGKLMNRAEKYMNDQQQQDQTRWAALTASKLLNKYEKEYKAVVEALREGKDIKQIIAAVEAC